MSKIHRGFDFSQIGGFPLNQARLATMQQAYAELSGCLAAFIGDNSIVCGCVISGNNVTDGWIVCQGELLPFIGGAAKVQDTFIIRQVDTPLTFFDGMAKPVQFNRYAEFGTGTNAVRWETLNRVPKLQDLRHDITVLQPVYQGTTVFRQGDMNYTDIILPFRINNLREYTLEIKLFTLERIDGKVQLKVSDEYLSPCYLYQRDKADSNAQLFLVVNRKVLDELGYNEMFILDYQIHKRP